MRLKGLNIKIRNHTKCSSCFHLCLLNGFSLEFPLRIIRHFRSFLFRKLALQVLATTRNTSHQSYRGHRRLCLLSRIFVFDVYIQNPIGINGQRHLQWSLIADQRIFANLHFVLSPWPLRHSNVQVAQLIVLWCHWVLAFVDLQWPI